MTNSDTSLPVVDRATHLVRQLSVADGLLLGLDFDGTLTPIARDPDAPTLPESVERSLRTLASRPDTQVAIISGRELDDLRGRATISDVIYAGNHGLELYRDGNETVVGVTEQQQAALRKIYTRLRSTVSDVPGCHIEDKGVTLTVHVRETPPGRVEKVRDAVVTVTGETGDVHVTTGKQVFEIRPSVDHDKGTTMQHLEDEVPADWLTLYLGDDTTDEDAFEAIQPEGVGIHVGTNTDTAAAYRIATQEDVPTFLTWLTQRSRFGR